jgi:hypothetical protein
MFLSLLVVEKPALGRGLDALMSGRKGESGAKAAELLTSFQAKRTRVGKGLGAFLKGGQRMSDPEGSAPSPNALPETPVEATPSRKAVSAPSMPPLAAMRANRSARPAPRPIPTPAAGMPNYRCSRRPRATNPPSSPAAEKSEPAPAASPGNVIAAASKPVKESAGEPAFQRPFVRPRPTQVASEATQLPSTPPGASPAFRLSLFIVDLSLWIGSFILALNAPPGSHLLLFLCCLAVVVGGALGVWGLTLEPDGEE